MSCARIRNTIEIEFSLDNSYIIIRGVARGGAEGARAPPGFGRSVNPIQTRGGRLCPSHYCQPPRIKKAIYTSVVGTLTRGCVSMGARVIIVGPS